MLPQEVCGLSSWMPLHGPKDVNPWSIYANCTNSPFCFAHTPCLGSPLPMSANSFSFIPFCHRTFLLSLRYQLVQSKCDRNGEIPFPPLLISISSRHFFSPQRWSPSSPSAPSPPKLEQACCLTPCGSYIDNHFVTCSFHCFHPFLRLSTPSCYKPQTSLLKMGPASPPQTSSVPPLIWDSLFPVCGLPYTGTLLPCPDPLGHLWGFSITAHRRLKTTSSLIMGAGSPPISPRDCFFPPSALPVPIQPLLSRLPEVPTALALQESA